MTKHEKLILNKYEILEEIGRGGMGVVYRARDIRIARTVAIKELLINPALVKASDEIIARFHREAQTAGSLQHINIVTIHDFGEDDGHHYIAMEFLEGQNLKEMMDDEYPFKPEELLDIFIQTAEGLQHAHERNIVHRDIKPDNISITTNGVVKITDFGIARMSTNNPMMQMTQDGTMLGTLGYISPEQLQNSSAIDNRADIFSFGAMMYELYTGRLPFDGGNVGATILKIVSEDPVTPSQVNDKVDPRVEAVIMKALQKLPDYRFQNASEIAAALKAVRDGETKSSEPTDSSNASGMEVCPCDKKNMIVSGAKFCAFCGKNIDELKAMSLENSRTASMKQPLIRIGREQPSKPKEPAPKPVAQKTSFKERLSHLIELSTTYQSAARGSIERQTFSRPATSDDSMRTTSQRLMGGGYSFIQDKTEDQKKMLDRHFERQASKKAEEETQKKQGGVVGAQDVDKSSLDVRFTHKVGQVGAGKGQFYQPRGLALSKASMIFVADTQNQRVQVFNSMGDWQYLIRSDGQNELKAPCNVAVDSDGSVYVVDSGTSSVSVFDQSGRYQRTFGSQGKGRGEFSNPYGIAISSKGEIYVADTGNSRVQVLDKKGRVNKIFGRPGTRPGEFKSPYAIALDAKDNLFVLDYGIPRVQVLDRRGISRLTFGKRGVKEGEFSIPRGLSIDTKGRIYIADTLNHRIQVFTPQGEFIEAFGRKGRGPTDFWGPESIAVTTDGSIFVLDKGNSRIQVLKAQNF